MQQEPSTAQCSKGVTATTHKETTIVDNNRSCKPEHSDFLTAIFRPPPAQRKVRKSLKHSTQTKQPASPPKENRKGTNQRTCNSRDSPVVTHPATDPTISSLRTASRPLCPGFLSQWSYTPDPSLPNQKFRISNKSKSESKLERKERSSDFDVCLGRANPCSNLASRDKPKKRNLPLWVLRDHDAAHGLQSRHNKANP